MCVYTDVKIKVLKHYPYGVEHFYVTLILHETLCMNVLTEYYEV